MSISTEFGMIIGCWELLRRTSDQEILPDVEKAAMVTLIASEVINKFCIHIPQEQRKFFFQGEVVTKFILLTGVMICHNTSFPIAAKLGALALTAILINSNIAKLISQIQNPEKRIELMGVLYGSIIGPIFISAYLILKK
jgi:hypothetical protein